MKGRQVLLIGSICLFAMIGAIALWGLMPPDQFLTWVWRIVALALLIDIRVKLK